MPDETIRYVGRTWEPRFLANGVDAGDYRRVVDGLETWDQWYGAWMEFGRRHEGLTRGAERRVACYARALPWLEPPGERVEFPLEAIRIPAYLRRPAGGPASDGAGVARPPVVLFLSGLDSVKAEHPTFERFFLRRGLATLTLDGPGQARPGTG